MLDHDTRAAILTLSNRGTSIRAIARAVNVSRTTVKKVLESGVFEPPALEREHSLDEDIETVRSLIKECKGNLVRVHEKLVSEHKKSLSYPALTRFCRRHELAASKKKKRAGKYTFDPAEEMQHDTSPHDVKMGGKIRRLQCASLIMCYSRKIYFQVYPSWKRFEAKSFLTEALKYMGGAAKSCMLDNSTVIMMGGTGPGAYPVEEMKAFQQRFGFDFVAHLVGDANRSGRVERPFHHIENNFYPGRTFEDINDVNRQAIVWCNTKNDKRRKDLGDKSANELFVVESRILKPLPEYIPEVYRLERRRVDVEGLVSLDLNRYSVAERHIGRDISVRASTTQVRIFDGPRLLATHPLLPSGAAQRSILPEHRHPGRRGSRKKKPDLKEEALIRGAGESARKLLDAIKKKHPRSYVHRVRKLHQFITDYPEQPLKGAIDDALEFGLIELDRIEKMILKRVNGDYFKTSYSDEEEENHDEEYSSQEKDNPNG